MLARVSEGQSMIRSHRCNRPIVTLRLVGRCFVFWGALSASRAWAASLCGASQVVPRDGAAIPANVNAIAFLPGFRGLVGDDAGAYVPTLKLSDGAGANVDLQSATSGMTETIESSDGVLTIYRPTDALLAGQTYTIVRSNPCVSATTGGPVTPAETQSRFTTTAATTWPTSLGALVVGTPVRETLALSGSDFLVRVDGVRVDVTVKVNPDVVPYDDVLFLKVRDIDGRLVQGEVPAAFPLSSSSVPHTFRVVMACTSTFDSLISPALAQGEHRVSIVGQILGMDQPLPALEATVTLDCNTATSGTGCDPDSAGCGPNGQPLSSVDAGAPRTLFDASVMVDMQAASDSSASRDAADSHATMSVQCGGRGCAMAPGQSELSGLGVAIGIAIARLTGSMSRRRRR
jgi:hypothetical protein